MYIYIKPSRNIFFTLLTSCTGIFYAAQVPMQDKVLDQLIQSSGYVLSLNNCGLSDDAISRLSDKLKNNTFITNINLGVNSFSDQGFKALIDVLPCTVVKTLTVNSNRITDEGIGYLCASRYANNEDSPLQYIDVRDNPLTDNSRIWLAKVAAVNKKLQICCSWDQKSEILKKELVGDTSTGDTSTKEQNNITENGALATGCSLFYIIWNENLDDETCAGLIKQLIAHGANVNFRDDANGGFEALHLAIQSKGIKTVEVLCEAGANLSSKMNNKRTALDIATELKRIDIVCLLLHYAEKNKTNNQ